MMKNFNHQHQFIYQVYCHVLFFLLNNHKHQYVVIRNKTHVSQPLTHQQWPHLASFQQALKFLAHHLRVLLLWAMFT